MVEGGATRSLRTSIVAASVCAWLAAALPAFAQASGQVPAAAGTVQAQTPAQGAAPATAQDDPLQVTNVGGHWELNWQQSDKPPEAAVRPGDEGEGPEGGRGSRGGPPPGGGMGGMGGGRMGGRGGMGRGERAGADDPSAREEMREALETARTLLIVEHPDRVTITNEKGAVRKLAVTPGDTKVKEDLGGGRSVERRTRWDGRKLVTEAVYSGGTKVTETFEKVAEGLQLIVTTKVENKRMGRPLELKRVYDQALEAK
jgi:hypothetical protein